VFAAILVIAELDARDALVIGGIAISILVALAMFFVVLNYGALWFQAYMSSADVNIMSLVGMGFRQVKPKLIVGAKIMGAQAGLDIERGSGMSTARLEAHFLAGGDVVPAVGAVINRVQDQALMLRVDAQVGFGEECVGNGQAGLLVA